MIDRQTRHMTRLVDDLLDVSRITRGTIALQRRTIPLTSVVEQAIEQVRPLIDQRGHRFTLKLPSAPLELHADPDRLEQILVNLLGNAAKYTQIGGRISLEVVRDGQEAAISVKDDGVGLAPELRERVFDLFMRSAESGVHAPGGLGVGLTLARRLAELHGGSIEARSDGPDRGSEFLVRLPLAAAPESADRLPSEVPAAGSDGRRILVVDDNADAADGLADFLRALGHSVRAAYDGASAIADAMASPPEIVVLDIGMPALDGHEVARRLRAEASLRSVVLVALSGYGQESDRRLSQEAGFDDHLVKPVDLARLEALLKRPS